MTAAPVPFRRKILFFLVLVGFAVLLVGLALTAVIETRGVKSEIAAIMQEAARSSTALINDVIHQHHRYIEQAIASLPDGDDLLIHQYLTGELSLFSSIDNYFVLNEGRRVIATSTGKAENFIGFDFSYRDDIKQEFAVSPVRQSLVRQNPVITISYPLKQGRILLVEKNLFSIAPILRHINQGGRLAAMFVFVLTADGTVVYHPLAELVSSRHNLGFELQDWSAADANGLRTYSYNGQRFINYRTPFRTPDGWFFYASIPLAETTRMVGKVLIAEVLHITLFFLVLLFVFQLLINRKISRPISQVTSYLTRFNPMQDVINRQGLADDVVEINQILDAMEKMAVNIREAQEKFVKEKELLSVTLRSIGDGVITTDLAGRVVMLNKVAETLTGWRQDEACGRPLHKVFHIVCEKSGELCESPVQQVLATGQTVESANGVLLLAKDGAERIIVDSGAPIRDWQSRVIGVVLVFHDVTEQRILVRDAQKAQKLESLGVLAGGIAHDFNNLLTAIWGNISYAKMQADAGSDIHSALNAAATAAKEARNLTRQLLTFAKGGSPIRQTVAITEIITDSADFALHGSNVSYVMVLDEDIWPVDVDPGQISQVINNLMINAAQVMPKGGVVTIFGGNVVVEAEDDMPLTAGRYVRIVVEDEGEGMTEEVMRQIFDPYFTTKEKGSGLGLASSYSIAKRHGGCLTAGSLHGKGAAFYLYMPASDKLAAEVTAGRQVDEVTLTGKGRILVMDDEEMIRDLVGKILKHLEYEVSLAADGEKSIKLYKEAFLAGRPFAAVIMDLTIPGGMGGEQAVREVLKINPAALVIVSSGYAHDPIMAEYAKYGFSGVLVKPYSIAEMSRVLYEVLQAGEQGVRQ